MTQDFDRVPISIDLPRTFDPLHLTVTITRAGWYVLDGRPQVYLEEGTTITAERWIGRVPL